MAEPEDPRESLPKRGAWQSTFRKPELLDRTLLEKLIDTNKPIAEQAYLRDRWLAMVLWWDSRSTEPKRKYHLLRAIIIGGGGLTTVLTAVQLAVTPDYASAISVVIAVVGAVIASVAAWEGIQSYGEIWREKRRAGEMLKVEGWLFLSRSGDYARVEPPFDAFRLFVSRVEAMFAKEVGDYIGLFDPSKGPKRQSAR